jgi:hypothetical protein
MDIKMYKNKHISAHSKEIIEKLEKQLLELILENAELKDIVLDNGGEYTEDFEVVKLPDSNDFEVKRDIIYESPDGGKTIYSRRAGDTERTVVDTGQMSLFND